MWKNVVVLIGIAMLAAGAAACGSGDNNPTKTPTPSLQSQSGLSVAFALQAGQRALDRSTSGASGSSQGAAAVAPGAKTTDGTASSNLGSLSYSLSNDGLTVTGYGMAAANADSAILELYFSTSSSYPKPATGSSGSSSSGSAPDVQTTPTTAGISEADLQPVIDALVAVGVDRSDIEYIGGSYYDPYYASATLRVTVKEIGKLGDLMKAASDSAATLTNVYLQGNYVSYTISDCSALESSAMTEAAKDADARSKALAAAVSVTRGAVKGASSDAYSPFGGTACSGGYVGPYPVGGVTYAKGQPSQVQVYATVSVTYTIQ
jgi:uncharacterized protein YggE